MLEKERLLKKADKLDPGFFALGKVEYVEPDSNVPFTNRCDNYTIAGTIVAQGTEYEGECIVVGKKSDYSDTLLMPEHVKRLEYPLFFPPHFIISYIEIAIERPFVPPEAIDIQIESTPSAMWIARSMYQLFKNIREWSFMVDEPFSSQHPMAIYSKLVLDSLNPPQEILDEIDAMPDMHLAKFLKGRSDFKLIPDHPVVSESFENWIFNICEQYPYQSFEEQIS
jgi:hypothetical protein